MSLEHDDPSEEILDAQKYSQSPKIVIVDKFAENFLLEAECGETTFTHEFRQHLKNKLIEQIKLAMEEARLEGINHHFSLCEQREKEHCAKGFYDGQVAIREECAKLCDADGKDKYLSNDERHRANKLAMHIRALEPKAMEGK